MIVPPFPSPHRPEPLSHEGPALGGCVLVADADAQRRGQLTAAIAGTGATCSVVGQGDQAVEQALAGRFDLLLVAQRLPVLDGADVVAMLRAAGYAGRIAALPTDTAADTHAGAPHPGTGTPPGCDDVLAPPLDRARLFSLLQRHLPPAGMAPLPEEDLGLEDVVRALAAEFRAEAPATAAGLADALEAGRWQDVRFISHRIKGIAGSIGLPELTQLAGPVEVQIKAGNLDAAGRHAQALVAALRAAALPSSAAA